MVPLITWDLIHSSFPQDTQVSSPSTHVPSSLLPYLMSSYPGPGPVPGMGGGGSGQKRPNTTSLGPTR